jgi:N-acetylglucosaminyl-diphospho-decaprenol L-rhamnosyltransferase
MMEGQRRLAGDGNPQVTVAVVSWNTRDLLETCLHSIAPEVDARRAEVWVVDNSSSDGSPEMVETQFPWARLVRSGANLGFGRAVNLVARSTTAPWIAPSNADIELTPGALETLLAAGEEHPGAGCLAPRLILPDGSTQASVQRFPSVWLTLGRTIRLQRLSSRLGRRLSDSSYWDPERPDVVEWATGAFLLVRRSAWRMVGGFDDSQWMYAEDLDLCWRARKRGWKIWFLREAEFVHLGAGATRKYWGSPRRAELIGESESRMIARNLPRFSAMLTIAFIRGGLALRVLVFRLLGRREAAASLRAALRAYRLRAH